jgi:two-component system, sensor histidine kinase and response regulator
MDGNILEIDYMTEPIAKILVIEDAADLRDDLIEMLTLDGYQTHGAENGLVGVKTAKEVMPDLIVCDIMMPEMDGYDVLLSLRGDPETAGIPFIFLTARTEHIDRRQGMVLGADDYLTKPFDVEELLESIHTQIEKRQKANAAAKLRQDQLRESIVTALPHELRTPLNTIIGFSEMLQSEAQYLKPDQVASWAGHIHTAAYRLYHLVENYLYYVRLQVAVQQNTAPEIHEKMDDMRAAIEQQAISLSQKYKRPDDIVLSLEPCPPLTMDYKDGLKMPEELIDNAFKFSKAGQAVKVTGKRDGDCYTLTVEDKGRGMTPDQVEHIGGFIQFERWLHEQQGMGLGLIVVKLLSEIYHADLKIDGKTNEGTSVTLRLKIT